MAFIAGAIVVALIAGVSAYMQSEAAASQARMQRRAAEAQEQAALAAAEARRRHVLWKAERQMRQAHARQAAAGVQIGEGASLLESTMDFASSAEYDAQLQAYGHQLEGAVAGYQGKLFGFQERRIRSQQALQVGLAVGSSLASSYTSSGANWGSQMGGSSWGNWSQSSGYQSYRAGERSLLN